jgi:hypothetical protein|tara:strand:+ start:4815 stop:5054 length:240 start_codon:yes stop_codon:yes gene_type:complete
MSKKYHIYEIEWDDSGGYSGWRDIDACKAKETPAKCRTAGYLLKKDKKIVLMALSLADNDDAGDRVCIPRACITSIRKL